MTNSSPRTSKACAPGSTHWSTPATRRLRAFQVLGQVVEHCAGLVDEANAVTETLRPGVVVGRPRLEPLVGDGIRVLPDASLEILTRNGLEAVTSGEVSLLGMQPRAEGEAR